MRRAAFGILILALGILACTKVTPVPNALGIEGTRVETGTLVPTPSPSSTATALGIIVEPAETPNALGITGTVYIREIPNADGKILGHLDQGDSALGICTGDWCEIPNAGWIWRGCTTDNPNALGCEVKK